MDQDLKLLRKAIAQYIQWDFRFLEYVPVVVDVDCLLATASNNQIAMVTDTKGLVGSAEQSFLQLIKEGKLEGYKRYQAVTDCVRPLDNDDWHQQVFKKLELISITTHAEELDSVICAAEETMKHLLKGLDLPSNTLEIVPTDEGFDLELNGIEVGSYGNRVFRDIHYVYGTGLALPRFLQAAAIV